MESVKVEQIEWLLYPFIPFGKVTIIQGDPGEGKTTMVLQIIAKLTRGESILLNQKSQKEAQKDSEKNLKQEVLSQDADCHPKRPPVPYYPASVSHIIRPAINHYSTVLLT